MHEMDGRDQLACPMCGSSLVETTEIPAAISAPFGAVVQFKKSENHCGRCGESGDFAQGNDSALSKAYAESEKTSADAILRYLISGGYSMAYAERALGLPARTLTRWRAGEWSAGPMALLRLIRVFPWLLEVADQKFQENSAQQILVREAARVLAEKVQEQRMKCTVALSSQPASSMVSIRLDHPHQEAKRRLPSFKIQMDPIQGE